MNPKISSKTALILSFMSYIRIFATGKTMNFLPKPPTDNLYKLIALIGTWLVTIGVFYLIVIAILEYRLELVSKKQVILFSAQDKIELIDQRLNSIEKGNLDESILAWSPHIDGNQKEVDFLNSQLEKLKNLENKFLPIVQNNEPQKYSNYLFKTYLHVLFSIILFFVGGTMFYVGYRLWYSRVQKCIDQQQQYDLKIKRLTALKLLRELKNDKKSGAK